MSNDTKELLAIIGFIILVLVVLFGSLLAVGYVSNAQRLECNKLNAHRTAAEVFTVCNKF